MPGPKADGLLKLEGYRLPLAPMVLSSAENPEINAAHHRHLVQWALHRGYSVPDSEIFDATRSSLALAEFERYFGLPVDSDLRRAERIDVEHHNVAILV
ncbi:MAG: hypothetical protein PWQ61_3393 [Betaproteobacteria bacterium]|nr:hypothetical protein [Betaproteobacteria bacterium]